MVSAFAQMLERHAQPGRVACLLVRPARLEQPCEVPSAEVTLEGLAGDHARPGKRAVTLIQAEHLPVIGALLGRGAVDAAILRRNIVVEGLNLSALRGRRIRVGTALLEITGPCAPCSRMEAALGPGGYSALRGHGGWCASVLEPGEVGIGDPVLPVPDTGDES